uniref:SbsA Ig-like domain-containing protein n=1 Tax=mine drainage metagenome TaxID=410659 RepID=E6PUI8_9ZZZZ
MCKFRLVVALLACGVAPLTLAGTQAAQFMPADGASQVDRVVQPGVRLASAQAAAALTPGRLQLRTPIGTLVTGLLKVSGDTATFEPAAPLAGCTCYTLDFSAAHTPGALPVTPVRSSFTTACSDWTPPTEIDDARTARLADRPASGVQLASGARGAMVAAWFQNDGVRNAIELSRFAPATEFWSAPVAIDLRGPGAGAANIPALVADARGEVTAVWFQALQGHNTIQARRLAADGDGSPPVRLDDPALSGNATNPQLAANAAGDVAVVWQQPDGHHTGIFASGFRVSAGHWQPAMALDHSGANAYNPVVAASADGGFIAAWQQGARGHEAVMVAQLPDDAAHGATGSNPWTRPWRIGPAGVRAQNPALIGNPQGGATVAWVQGSGALRRIAVRQLAAGQRNAPLTASPVTLMQSPAFRGAALAPALVSDAAGNITLAWEQADVAAPAQARYAILASRFDAATRRWSTPVQLDDPKQASAGNPVLVADSAGNVTAAWYQDGPRGMQVQAARYDPSAARWSAATLLSDARTTVEASFPALAVDTAGSVTAAWQQYNGWRTVVMASQLP